MQQGVDTPQKIRRILLNDATDRTDTVTTAYDPTNRAWLLPQAVYNTMTRAERLKHRRKAVKSVERKFQRIAGIEANGLAIDKRKIREQWTNRELTGSLRVPNAARYKWESV